METYIALILHEPLKTREILIVITVLFNNCLNGILLKYELHD